MARMSRQMREVLAELEARGAIIVETPPTLAAARWILRDLGPRRVGGRYLSGYWGQHYEVLDIQVAGEWWAMTVRWDDGNVTTHSTRWERRDRTVK